MTSKIKPSQRGKGRVEYLGLVKEIEQNLLAGHTRRAVHDHLTSDGRMTISYQRFCHYVTLYSPHCSLKDITPKHAALQSASALPVTKRVSSIPEENQKFSHENNPSKESIKKLT